MENNNTNYAIPVSIIIVGLLIAGAIYFGPAIPRDDNKPITPINTEIDPVTSVDHLRGDINAPVKIVEYSDLECPFCKRFHNTMKEVVAKYDGKQVAWVYRHYPIDSLHRKARNEAAASECAAEQGGEEAFWQFIDRVFEVTPGNDGLDPAELPKIADELKLDVVKFEICLKSGQFDTKIEASVQSALKAGAQGTPYPIVLGPNGQINTLPGAVPLIDVTTAIDKLLK
ncbi:MAG: DsbA family protein [Candidatus Vogelbacteria bacterium]|nr:DsbA family protein [Candidatus Vogelbacteria bacterium]